MGVAGTQFSCPVASENSSISSTLTLYLISGNVHHARVRYVDVLFLVSRGKRDSAEVPTHLGSVAYRAAYDISLGKHIANYCFCFFRFN